MSSITIKYIHLCLLGFLGISAIGGGGALILSPSGKLLGGLPLTILERSPFNDFFIPGIILFVVLGLLPILLVIALINKSVCPFAERINFFGDMHWAWSYGIYVAFALIIWILVESIFVGSVGWLQAFYLLYAIPVIFVSLLPQVRAMYKK